MVKGEFFTIEHVTGVKDNHKLLRFFGRDEHKNKIDVTIEGNKPYFYILESDEKHVNFPCQTLPGHTSIFKDKLLKISYDNPWHIRDSRDPLTGAVTSTGYAKRFDRTFEADVLYSQRHLIDNNIYTGISIDVDKNVKASDTVVEPRIMLLDIETEYYGGENVNMDCPINSITFHDNYTDQLYVISVRPDGKIGMKDYIYTSEIIKDDKGQPKTYKVKHEELANEIVLLKRFKKYVLELDVDIFSAWNSTFDLTYIVRRLERLNLKPGELSPLNKYYYSTQHVNSGAVKAMVYTTKEKKVMIRGRAIIDLLKGYKRLKWNQIDSFRLDSVAKKEFNIGKLEYTGWTGDFWKNDYDNFIKYNIRDVEICLALDKQYSVHEFLLNLRRLSGCELTDVHYNSRMFDIYILRYVKNKFILPSKSYEAYDKKTSKFEGGFVLEPVVGIHKNIAVLDLKSLYPSIMLSFNMSPETIDDEGEILVGNGIKFKKEDGILKNILIDLINRRDELRDLLKTEAVYNDKKKYLNVYRRQYAYKTFTNSAYGITGFPSFRLYNPNIASSITYIGRWLNNKLRECAEEHGCIVVRADTDSIMIDTKKTDKEEVMKIAKKVEEEINDKIKNEWFEGMNNDTSYISIKFEKLYSLMFSGKEKKLYAGKTVWDWEKGDITNNPDIEIKGFATKRSDRSTFSRNLQKEVFNLIFDEQSNAAILSYIKLEIDKFYKNKYPLEYIGLPKAITKDIHSYKANNPWITGVKFSLKHVEGFQFSPKPLLLYTKESQNYYTTNFCFNNENEVPPDLEIDWEKMLEVSVYNIIKNIIIMLGEDPMLINQYIKNKVNQQTELLEFFK